MTTGTLSVADKVRDAVAEVAEVPVDEVRDTHKLGGEELKIGRVVGLVEFLELKVLLEKGCGVRIPDEVQMGYKNLPGTTVGDLIVYMEGLVG